jgi:hypothetical protein
VASESKSRIRRSLGARRVSAAPGAGSRAWLVVTVLGALLSFSAAVGYSLLSSQPKKTATVEDDEPLPNVTVRQPSKDLGIRTRRDLLPGGRPRCRRFRCVTTWTRSTKRASWRALPRP